MRRPDSFCPIRLCYLASNGQSAERQGLSAPADVILDRVARRTTNNYGKTPLERAMILDDLARVEPLLREGSTHELDASRPLADIVADLTAIASRPMTTS
jgi:hypothetical protein